MATDPVQFTPGNPMSFNRYLYVNGNPYKYNDPDGRFLDTILDVGFVIADVAVLAYDEIANGGQNRSENLLALGADTAGLFIPFATGGGAAVRGARAADNLADAAKGADDVTNSTVKANKVAGNLGEDAVRARLLNSNSVDLVGEQVRINTPGVGSHRVTDFLVRGKNTGKMRIIEVKTGGATRNSSQLVKDSLIADPASATTFSGRRARAADLPNGTPTGGIKTYEVNASNLNR